MPSDPTNKIKFHYIKADSFRVIPASGVWGGVNTRGSIDMTFFTERAPIPKVVSHEITSEGQLGMEVDRKTKEGLVRDVQVSVLIDLPFAKSFRDWLDDKINELESRKNGNKPDGELDDADE